MNRLLLSPALSLARRALAILLLVLALARPVSAFIGSPYLTPQHPTENDAISVNLYSDQCDVVDAGIPWPPPVTSQESQVTILFTGIHEEDPEFCYFGVGTSSYPVGTFLPGSYTLNVERRYMDFSGWIQETLGVITFTVSDVPSPQPIEAPTLSAAGLGGLLLALLAMALLALARVECSRAVFCAYVQSVPSFPY